MNIFAKKMITSTAKSLWMEYSKSNFNNIGALEDCSIVREFKFNPSQIKLNLYQKMLGCNKDTIPPFFPYVLLTPWHFDLVTDKAFPFAPLGILHKKEEINLIKPLRLGEWSFRCEIKSFNSLDNGVEFILQSDLFINDELHWRSITTAFKKLSNKKNRKVYPSLKVDELKEQKLFTSLNASKYGLLSQNIDPIHMSPLSAKLMGHPSSILHGMFLGAFFCKSLVDDKTDSISLKFIKPLYLPNRFFLFKEAEHYVVTDEQKKSPFMLIMCSTR